MTNIVNFRVFQSAAKYKGNPQLYAALIRDIKRDQANGLTGHVALHEARQKQAAQPKGAA